MKLFRLQIASIATALLCFVSCGGKDKGLDVPFTFALATEVDDYDPFTNVTADGRSLLFNIYEGLSRISSNEEMAAKDGSSSRFSPCLAEKWEHNGDCSEWTFWIKSGVHFHDGSPLTAEDAASSLTRARDTGFAGCASNILDAVASGGTVKVRLIAGDTSFIAAMICPIVKYKDDKPYGTGPYMLGEYLPGDCAVLRRYDDYHGEKPSLKAVKVKFAGGQSALPLLLLSGAIDGFVATGDLSNEVSDNAAVKNIAPSNAVQMLALNNDAPMFEDERVRRAVRCLIDADSVIKTASGGYGMRAISPVIPALMNNDEALLKEVSYNAEAGASLLNDAGAAGLSFTITVPSNYTVHIKAAEVIADMLSRAGVKADIKQVDWATWISEVYVGRNYEATIISVDASLATAQSFLSRYVSTASNNFVNFKSEAFDNAFDALLMASSEEDKTRCANDAVNVLINEAASVWIEDIEQVTVYNKRFEGFRSYPLFAIDFAAIAPCK